MIQITPHMRILVAVEPVDFRAGIDALAGICRQRLQADPFAGTLFVFANRRRTAVRVLVYDGQGFWLCTKRLSSGRFACWPVADVATHPLLACQLQALLMAGDPTGVNAAPNWRQLIGPAYTAAAGTAAGASCSR
jgi:transposase